jgi:hypothetical protein
MRKKLWSVTLAALAIAVVLTFGACSQQGPVDTGSTYVDVTMIHGYVSVAGSGDPIPNAEVWAHLEGDPPSVHIGDALSGQNGYYEIKGDRGFWDYNYDGENLSVHAYKEDFVEGEDDITITNFDIRNIPYEIDFNLVPIP